MFKGRNQDMVACEIKGLLCELEEISENARRVLTGDNVRELDNETRKMQYILNRIDSKVDDLR